MRAPSDSSGPKVIKPRMTLGVADGTTKGMMKIKVWV